VKREAEVFLNTIHAPDRNDDLSGEETMALLLAIRGQGVMDRELLNLFEATPRRMFLNAGRVQAGLSPQSAAPISCGQVQSPPVTIANIVKALDVSRQDKVLEIGTGSGYQSAILARLCRRLHTIDRFRTLIEEASIRFQGLKLSNIVTRVGDGERGWQEQEVFDRIVVNAGVEAISTALLDQLKVGGILIAPILQNKIFADVVVHEKKSRGMEVKKLCRARFLPLIPGTAVRL